MTLTTGGNVGIGTSTPGTSLDIVKSDNLTTAISRFYANNLSQWVEVWYAGLRQGGSGANTQMNIDSKGTSPLVLNGTNTTGNVLIGTTTDTGKKLEVNGEVYSAGAGASVFIQARDLSLNYAFFAPDATALNFYSTSGGTVGNFNRTTGVYTATSDINKKKDFEASTIGLNAILGLKPTLYRMKLDDNNNPKQLGFIAQEVKEFIPQAYVESEEMIGLNDKPIIAALVKAIQEQQCTICSQASRISLLESCLGIS
jgi:hypothetical protein